MKKGILFLSVISMLGLGACASNSTAKADTKTGTQVRGQWVLSDVSYIGLDSNEEVTKVFDMAKPICYKGTTWSLNQNTKKGTYSFNSNDSECPLGTANIIWDIRTIGVDNFFTFKDVTGIKAKQNTSGYQLKIGSVDATSMRLLQDINFNGKIIQVVYSFNKTIK